ncbi:MAG: hypothetical protein LBT05_03995, partial [Planctomycetaceae bacterium]|nr:hypothetical protein [Planctomycetaceae bacterium]
MKSFIPVSFKWTCYVAVICVFLCFDNVFLTANEVVISQNQDLFCWGGGGGGGGGAGGGGGGGGGGG